MSVNNLSRFPTGITSLDELMEGGFPKTSSIGILGEVGSGKTTLCNQIVWNALQRKSNVLYYTVDESAEDVTLNFERFGFNIKPFLEKGSLRFVDVFSRGMKFISDKLYKPENGEIDVVEPDKVSEISFNFREMIMEGRTYFFNIFSGKELLVIYDSLSPLFMAVEREKVLRFLQYARYASRVSKAIGIATLDSGVHGTEIENACRQQADGVIELRKRIQDGHTARYIRVAKMARTKTREEYYPVELTNSGLIVYKIPLSF